MLLSRLAAACGGELHGEDVDVTAISEDTREVQPGLLFACVPGSTRDGHDHAEEVVTAGAVALLVERLIEVDAPQVVVPEVRLALAPVAAEFHGRPAEKLRIVGVTGTNGKTTTTQILTHVLTHAGVKTATIGTLSGQYTTPPPIQLQRTLAEFLEEGHQAVVMEVSSQGLVQRRVDGITFEVAAFTNLTQDHLDYHGTMEAYFEAKAMLFTGERAKAAVVNGDDPYGQRIMQQTDVPVRAYGLSQTEGLHVGALGSTLVWEGRKVALPLIGRFNVENALAAAETAVLMGLDVDVIVEALESVPSVPGRVERVDRGQPFAVLVDFAHTPDGLQGVLDLGRAAAKESGGRLTVVFGCGGDRDKEKRPQMGAIAAQLADVVIVTTDNARSEDPAAIAEDILTGVHDQSRVTVELDRARAIERAIESAEANDVVVIAGKGHEATQDIGGVKSPFDDRLVAAAALEKRSGTW